MSVNDACRIVIDNSRVMLLIVVSLTDGWRSIIYDCNMFIVQASGLKYKTRVELAKSTNTLSYSTLVLKYMAKEEKDNTLAYCTIVENNLD
jgi:hypothetical protein